MAVKPYKYRLPRIKRPPASIGAKRPPKEPENLTGYVQDKNASDIEERYARGLNKNPRVLWYVFREPQIAPAGFPGSVDLDFLVSTPAFYPIQIDGEYAHASAAQRERDRLNDAVLDDYLRRTLDAHPVQRVPWIKLETQEDADRVVAESF